VHFQNGFCSALRLSAAIYRPFYPPKTTIPGGSPFVSGLLSTKVKAMKAKTKMPKRKFP
jgi:hypothetical protein